MTKKITLAAVAVAAVASLYLVGQHSFSNVGDTADAKTISSGYENRAHESSINHIAMQPSRKDADVNKATGSLNRLGVNHLNANVAQSSDTSIPAVPVISDAAGNPQSDPNSNQAGNIEQAAAKLFNNGFNINGDSFYLKPAKNSSITASDANQVKELVTQAGSEFFQLRREDNLTPVSSSIDDLNNIYYTLQQTYSDLPVYGKVMVARADQNDSIRLLTGRFESEINVDTQPSLTGREAVLKGLYSLETAPIEQPVIHKTPELQIYIDEETRKPTLIYTTIVEYFAQDTRYHLDEVLVDAKTGQIVQSFPQVQGALNREIYSSAGKPCLSSDGSNINAVIPGTFRFGEQGSTAADTQESGAYEATGIAYWFYYYMYNRDSYNAQGIRLRSTVHAQFSSGAGGCSGLNAFYLAEPYDQMVFGDGDGTGGLSEALDAVAHELTHGVTHSTSDLKYQNESGAINEALSDIFGSGAEAWKASSGSASGNPTGGIQPNANTWIICDVCASGMQRYMNNPTQDGRSADYYPERYTGTNDNGGVHTNSGVMNLAFYLLSEGGSHPRAKTSTVVTGIGIQKALQIYYDANTQLFRTITNVNTAYADARRLLADAAETRYGACSVEWQAVQQSYDAVGVPGNWTPCDTNPETPAPSPDPAPAPAPTPAPPPTTDTETNLALSATVAATSTYSPLYVADNINDGDPDTVWRSYIIVSPFQLEAVALDFGATQNLGTITIDWSGNDFPRSFLLERQINNIWLPVQFVYKFIPGATVLNLNIPASQLRIQMTQGAFLRWFAIKEIKLTAGQALTATPAPLPVPLPGLVVTSVPPSPN